MTRQNLLVFLGTTVTLGITAFATAGADRLSAHDCIAVRDRELRALWEEKIAIETAFDNDTAISGAAEYHLEEALNALIADIERQRKAVEQRFRQCATGSAATPPK